MIARGLYLGCTVRRHAQIGIHAVINARGGEVWRNDLTNEDWEMRRDARAIRERIATRTRFYGFTSRAFRRRAGALAHLVSRHDD